MVRVTPWAYEMPTLPPFPLRSDVKQRLGGLGEEFLVGFLDRGTRRNPENLEALAELAHVLTRMGRVEEGLSADRRLVELAPNSPTAHYNLACSLSLLGQPEPAIDALERAIELGYNDVDHMVQDEDLVGLHKDARFQRLLERLEPDTGL